MVVIAYAFAFALGVAIFIELIKDIWWILLIGLGILIVFGIIVAIFCPGSTYSGSGGSLGGEYSSSSSSPKSDSNSNSSNEKGLFYKGSSASGMVTGTYQNGQIFDGYNSGSGISFIKATYCDGYVYEGTTTGFMGNVIGRYENGRIYKGNSTSSSDMVAAYGDGNIYPSPSSYSIIGKYTGDDEGGAAAAIYFMFYK